MPIQPQAFKDHEFPSTGQTFTERGAIPYALGVGLGQDPSDVAELLFLDERQLSALPTFDVTLTSPGMWVRNPAFGIDFAKLVHFEQMAWFPEPLPPAAEVIGEAQVVSLTDRGTDKGAVLVLERTIRDASSGALYCAGMIEA